MHLSLRIANWNIDRSGMRGKWRVVHQVELLEALKCDIHVLTEVHHDLMLHGRRAVALSNAGLPPYLPTDRATGIWTSLPVVRDHAVRTPGLAACVELGTPLGPTLVYATVLPYRDDQVKHGCERWQRHRETLALQMADWKEMRQSMPDHHLVIAGDFNMTMGNDNAYVDKPSRSQLLTNCDLIGLRCVTDTDFRPLVGRANVDHLLISPALEADGPVDAWPGFSDAGGKRLVLSDHNGIVARIRVTP